jgi:hypothetical protein
LDWGDGDDCTIVPVEEIDEFEARDVTEEEELVRWALFRGINIRATSSAFIVLAFTPHAARLFCWKLGGLATAVICRVYTGSI